MAKICQEVQVTASQYIKVVPLQYHVCHDFVLPYYDSQRQYSGAFSFMLRL